MDYAQGPMVVPAGEGGRIIAQTGEAGVGRNRGEPAWAPWYLLLNFLRVRYPCIGSTSYERGTPVLAQLFMHEVPLYRLNFL